MHKVSCLQLVAAAGLSLLTGFWSCASRPAILQPESEFSGLELAADTALFSALIRTLSDSLPEAGEVIGVGPLSYSMSPHPLRVDPRPLIGAVHFGAAQLATVPAGIVAARAEVLARLGVPEVDAVGPRNCPSWTVFAGALPEERDEVTRGCPREGFLTAIAGIPRPEEAASHDLPGDSAQEARQGHWSIMVITVPMGPFGIATTFSDYIFKRDDDGKGWRFVEKKVLNIVD